MKTPIRFAKYVLLTLIALSAQMSLASDFDYSFASVFAPNADQYVVSTTNLQKVNEGFDTYFCPIQLNAPATITYRFDFCLPTESAYLDCKLASFNLGSSQGYGSLWGSSNGVTWIQLFNVPTPVGYWTGDATNYNSNLPPVLLGSTNIWLQTRLFASGWNIASQWLRYNSSDTNHFRLAVSLYKPAIGIAKAITPTFSNLVSNNIYSLDISYDLTNWLYSGSFSATNSSMTHTQTWHMDSMPHNMMYFRLQGCPNDVYSGGW